jgi:hypothetical protein
VPTLLHALGVGVIEIDGDGIIWRSVGISEGKRSIRLRGFSDYASKRRVIARENAPFMPAAIKLWAV